MINTLFTGFALLTVCVTFGSVRAQDHRYDPPWNSPPTDGLQFTVPGIDNVPDLYGDITDPQLTIFFAGNQFMVLDSLLAAFKKQHPEYTRIFAETLPPGILAKQIVSGSITIGNMRITHLPDVYTAGKSGIDEFSERFSRVETYAKNNLAIMVRKGNSMQIKGLMDLGRPEVLVSMPNPKWEGIGKQIETAYIKAGGEALRARIMEDKVRDSTTYLTQIHHRQSPMRVLYGHSEAAPVWSSETHYQQMLGHPIETVEIPERENIQATYQAGQLKNAPHPEAAQAFMDFLISPTAKAIYRKYGFSTE